VPAPELMAIRDITIRILYMADKNRNYEKNRYFYFFGINNFRKLF